jgi:RNA polymerase sigma-B factor
MTGTRVSAISTASLDELSDEELLARCRELAVGDPRRSEVREVLVRRYEPAVRGVVRQYRGTPEPAEDLMQVGYLGLLKAINNFDPSFGRGLRPYAMPCITGEIKKHFRDRRWQVRVARPIQELLLQVREATATLTADLGRHPADAEVAARLEVTEDEIREARQAGDAAFSALSLDAP